MIGDDLVNSYHLLLCCLDLIFANALSCPNRRDLLNPSFKGMVGPDYLKSNVLCSLVFKWGWRLVVSFLPPHPLFSGLPADFHAAEIKAPEDPPCIIATLCELHDGLLVEAKGIKEHYFKPYISKLFDRKVHLAGFKNVWSCSDEWSRDRRNPAGSAGKCADRQRSLGWFGFSVCILAGAEFTLACSDVCCKVPCVLAFYVSGESLLSFRGSVKLNCGP